MWQCSAGGNSIWKCCGILEIVVAVEEGNCGSQHRGGFHQNTDVGVDEALLWHLAESQHGVRCVVWPETGPAESQHSVPCVTWRETTQYLPDDTNPACLLNLHT